MIRRAPFLSTRFPTTLRTFFTSPLILNQKINFHPPGKSNNNSEKKPTSKQENTTIQLQPNELVYEMAHKHIKNFNKILLLGLFGVVSVISFTQLQIVLDYFRSNLIRIRDIKEKLTDIDCKLVNTEEEIKEREKLLAELNLPYEFSFRPLIEALNLHNLIVRYGTVMLAVGAWIFIHGKFKKNIVKIELTPKENLRVESYSGLFSKVNRVYETPIKEYASVEKYLKDDVVLAPFFVPKYDKLLILDERKAITYEKKRLMLLLSGMTKQ